MTQRRSPRVHERWAQLRFSVVGQLLAAPPEKGTLAAALAALAAREWRHPTTAHMSLVKLRADGGTYCWRAKKG